MGNRIQHYIRRVMYRGQRRAMVARLVQCSHSHNQCGLSYKIEEKSHSFINRFRKSIWQNLIFTYNKKFSGNYKWKEYAQWYLWKNLTVNISNGNRVNVSFFFISGTKPGCFLFPLFFNRVLSFSCSNKVRKGNKMHTHYNERKKLQIIYNIFRKW